MREKRILTGDRPTGRLHLGHYVGSLKNRVRLQHEYESFFIIADLHVLTTRPDRAHVAETRRYIREIVLDYLAAGIDPEASTIFIQSAIPGTYQLNLLFEMLVSVPRLERVPSVKDMAANAHLESMPFGLLGYPVLQAADILLPRAINRFLDPIRMRRQRYADQPGLVEEILSSGNRRMLGESEQTMALVHEAVGLPGFDTGAFGPDHVRTEEVKCISHR